MSKLSHCKHTKTTSVSTFDSIHIFNCEKCGLIYSENLYKSLDLHNLYDDYYKNEVGMGRFKFGIETVIKLFRLYRAFKIYTIYPGAKRILDIGCGRGYSLYFLKRFFNYERTSGTQISQKAYEYAKYTLGLDIYNKDLLDISFKPKSFDVITLWHVLEHVNNPLKYFEKFQTLLAPGGKVIIEVPNYNSWTRRFTDKYWLGLDLKYHLTFYTCKSLTNFLQLEGFEIKFVKTHSLEYSGFISAQSLISKLTKTDSTLFNWIQGIGKQQYIFFHILLFVIIFPLCVIINACLYFTPWGEVLVVNAQKSDNK